VIPAFFRTLAAHEEGLRRFIILGLLFSMPVRAIDVTLLQDPDLWWHVRTGQWIVEHGTVPGTDPLSSYGGERPWVAYSWLFEIVLYSLTRVFGLSGVIVYSVAMLFLIMSALFMTIRQLEGRIVPAVVLIASGFFVILVQAAKPRPWHFTILFSVLTIYVILLTRRTLHWQRLLILPPLFALWANTHIQFVFGLLVIGLVVVESVVDSCVKPLCQPREGIPVSWAVLALLACIAATLINPYGWQIYGTVYELATQPGPLNYISELQALRFRSLANWLVLAITLGACATLSLQRHLRPFPILLLCAGVFISFRSSRDAWFVTVAGLAVIAAVNGDSQVQNGLRLSKAKLAALVLVIGAVSTVVWSRGISEKALQAAVAAKFPSAAAAMVERSAVTGPMYSGFDWGGYLLWRLPQVPVFLDGRTNLHGDLRIERHLSTWSGGPGWQHDPELAGANVVIVAVNAPLASLLRSDARFKLTYEDEIAAVYLRNSGGTP
jgi:hypothetical protein